MKVFVYLFKLHRKLRKSLECLTSYNRRDLKVKLGYVAIKNLTLNNLSILNMNKYHRQINLSIPYMLENVCPARVYKVSFKCSYSFKLKISIQILKLKFHIRLQHFHIQLIIPSRNVHEYSMEACVNGKCLQLAEEGHGVPNE